MKFVEETNCRTGLSLNLWKERAFHHSPPPFLKLRPFVSLKGNFEKIEFFFDVSTRNMGFKLLTIIINFWQKNFLSTHICNLCVYRPWQVVWCCILCLESWSKPFAPFKKKKYFHEIIGKTSTLVGRIYLEKLRYEIR